MKLANVTLVFKKKKKDYRPVSVLPTICAFKSWKKSLDNKSFGGSVFVGLSKAFDILNNELLIAKLRTYLINLW